MRGDSAGAYSPCVPTIPWLGNDHFPAGHHALIKRAVCLEALRTPAGCVPVPAGSRRPIPGACWVPAGCLQGACRPAGTRFWVPAALQAPDLQAPDFVSRLDKSVRVPGCLLI